MIKLINKIRNKLFLNAIRNIVKTETKKDINKLFLQQKLSQDALVQINNKMRVLTGKRRLLGSGIIDSSPNSFKDFVLSNNMPEKIDNLKKGLDKESIDVIETTLHKIMQLPDYTYAKYLYVDDNEFRCNFETEKDKYYRTLVEKNNVAIRTKYKLSKNDYDMEVFLYHHGLNFASERIKKYVEGKDFIDAGAYIGDSVLVFMHYNPNKIFSFEISRSSIDNYKKTMEMNNIPIEKYTLVPMGLSDKKGEIFISDDSTMSCKVFNSGEEHIEVIDLDSYLKGKNIDIGFIKADLEGSMYKALLGMKDTIRKFRPVLSFAIYHSPEEFFYTKPLLAEIVKDLNYTIKIDCHYSSCFHIYGTIIWAYPKELE